jgi:mono/diheme cytochrome c family protein
MIERSRAILQRACLALAWAAGSACAAGMNGPMSSTPKAGAASAAAPASQAGAAFDVAKLFATTCGWCHSGGGRVAGKGPQLMGTTLGDAEIIHRIKNGKTGAMPAFGSTFDDAQLQAIVKYIRELKPEGAAQ